MSHSINVGDGMVVCSANDMPNHLAPTNMVVREHFEVKRFDDQFPKGNLGKFRNHKCLLGVNFDMTVQYFCHYFCEIELYRIYLLLELCPRFSLQTFRLS